MNIEEFKGKLLEKVPSADSLGIEPNPDLIRHELRFKRRDYSIGSQKECTVSIGRALLIQALEDGWTDLLAKKFARRLSAAERFFTTEGD